MNSVNVTNAVQQERKNFHHLLDRFERQLKEGRKFEAAMTELRKLIDN